MIWRKTTAIRTLRIVMPTRPKWHALELHQETGIRWGALYPALYELEARGEITGEWDDLPDPYIGFRRRYYQVSPTWA